MTPGGISGNPVLKVTSTSVPFISAFILQISKNVKVTTIGKKILSMYHLSIVNASNVVLGTLSLPQYRALFKSEHLPANNTQLKPADGVLTFIDSKFWPKTTNWSFRGLLTVRSWVTFAIVLTSTLVHVNAENGSGASLHVYICVTIDTMMLTQTIRMTKA